VIGDEVDGSVRVLWNSRDDTAFGKAVVPLEMSGIDDDCERKQKMRRRLCPIFVRRFAICAMRRRRRIQDVTRIYACIKDVEQCEEQNDHGGSQRSKGPERRYPPKDAPYIIRNRKVKVHLLPERVGISTYDRVRSSIRKKGISIEEAN
jgi:hypothetical protein